MKIVIATLGGCALTRLITDLIQSWRYSLINLMLLLSCQFRYMEAFRPSVDALKRVVVGLGSELAPILSLEMAARDVWASRRKHATRKPVQVQKFGCFQTLLHFSVFFLCVGISVF